MALRWTEPARHECSDREDGMGPLSSDDSDVVAAALEVLDRHLAALNRGDAAALAQTLHFPHYRLASGRMQVWTNPENYLQDFYARAGGEWKSSVWELRNPAGCSRDKGRVGVAFTR